MEFMSPRFGTLKGRLEYSIDHDFSEGISGQPGEISLSDHRLRVPGFRLMDEDHELLMFGNLRVLDIDSSAILPSTGESFPDYFGDVEVGLAYKERISGSKIWGINATVGSPSNRPFASIHEIGLNSSVFLRLPAGEQDAWLFFLNYSNTRGFLEHIPLPGVAYIHRPGNDLWAAIGVPFTFVRYKPTDRWTLRGSYILLRTVHVQASYELAESLSVYGGFDWDSDVFFRHDRADNDDRLFYYEKSLSGGVRWNIREDLYVDFSGGYRFDRFFFEGEDYDDRGFNRLELGDGPFLALRVGLILGE